MGPNKNPMSEVKKKRCAGDHETNWNTQNPKKLHINKTGVWWTCNQTVRRDVVLISKNTRLNRRRKLEKKKKKWGIFVHAKSPWPHIYGSPAWTCQYLPLASDAGWGRVKDENRWMSNGETVRVETTRTVGEKSRNEWQWNEEQWFGLNGELDD